MDTYRMLWKKVTKLERWTKKIVMVTSMELENNSCGRFLGSCKR